MTKKSLNKFDIYGTSISIFRDGWEKVASATIRDDYIDELTSVTWSVNGSYLYNQKLGYLHRYIVSKWYGDETLISMTKENFIVDHLNNNGFDCTIDNLIFLPSDENKAKGYTLDKYREKNLFYAALNITKDFSTNLFQISINFNYPAELIIDDLSEPACIDLGFFLYKSDDPRIVINDARNILIEYENQYTFTPSKLNFIDYHIEGKFGTHIPIDDYNYFMSIPGPKVFILKRTPIKNWSVETPRNFINIRN